MADPNKGEMTVKEAGQKGGARGGRRGGETTRDRYGHGFYEAIGKKGGEKVRDLIKAGRRSDERNR
jgi:general stress protein YciG